MPSLYNIARMSTPTTGTGTITLGSAAPGFLSFAAAGVPDGALVSYVIEDGVDREVGTGVYTASGTSLTRNVTKSTNGDAAINLSGNAHVAITMRAEDFDAKAENFGGLDLKSDANYTVQLADHRKLLAFPLTTTNRTVTLPSAATAGLGFEVSIVVSATSTATLSITRSGSDTIGDGNTSIILFASPDRPVTLRSDGASKWYVKGGAILPAALTALFGLTPVAGSFPYYTGATTAALAPIESGTWTPTLTFQTPGDLVVGSYSQQAGTYSRVGSMVTAAFRVAAPMTHSTASGLFQITGFPFTSRAGQQLWSGALGMASDAISWTSSRTIASLMKTTNSTNAGIWVSGPAVNGFWIQVAQIASGNEPNIFGSVTYEVA